ncbi:MAG: GIY-YIG nuclease [Edafosvirus sp.]|uniref:GIY-YIG nuclease n=1 Tax=Edafosvirus sp. TaxID=2487765 RepID=A0A3G4ZTZ2_9VIRU|nr:MAG: GIY-YIG nuclease [Edafosvirus sp.]
MIVIYILKLSDNKYYVGKTNNLDHRIEDHIMNLGSAWTKLYPFKEVLSMHENCDEYDEDKYTIKTMGIYGIDNVRGGSFANIELSNAQKEVLTGIIRNAQNKCFKCGYDSHFSKECYAQKDVNGCVTSHTFLSSFIVYIHILYTFFFHSYTFFYIFYLLLFLILILFVKFIILKFSLLKDLL